MPLDRGHRRRFWRSLGATAPQADELVAYAAMTPNAANPGDAYPLEDEPFVEAWRSYVERAGQVGVLSCLREIFVQLRFPIRAGISETDSYKAAVRRGLLPLVDDEASALRMLSPLGTRLWLHPTPAGHIPVVLAASRETFVTLIQALVRQNEPSSVPASLGACMIAGYNNWARLFELRRRWEATDPGERRPADWPDRFEEILRQPALYQDRFILLAPGPYSAVPAERLGLVSTEWEAMSLTIRLEHECTHYFTRRVLGTMRNALTDELIADYFGIVAAQGRYRADWFLNFVGLEDFPRYRSGARLEHYRGDPPLSEGSFRLLQRAVKMAAENLEVLDNLSAPTSDARVPARSFTERARMILALTSLGLEGIASPEARTMLPDMRFPSGDSSLAQFAATAIRT